MGAVEHAASRPAAATIDKRVRFIGYRPRNPRLQPWGGKGAQTLRWFATYSLIAARGAPPTVATK